MSARTFGGDAQQRNRGPRVNMDDWRLLQCQRFASIECLTDRTPVSILSASVYQPQDCFRIFISTRPGWTRVLVRL